MFGFVSGTAFAMHDDAGFTADDYAAFVLEWILVQPTLSEEEVSRAVLAYQEITTQPLPLVLQARLLLRTLYSLHPDDPIDVPVLQVLRALDQLSDIKKDKEGRSYTSLKLSLELDLAVRTEVLLTAARKLSKQENLLPATKASLMLAAIDEYFPVTDPDVDTRARRQELMPLADDATEMSSTLEALVRKFPANTARFAIQSYEDAARRDLCDDSITAVDKDVQGDNKDHRGMFIVLQEGELTLDFARLKSMAAPQPKRRNPAPLAARQQPASSQAAAPAMSVAGAGAAAEQGMMGAAGMMHAAAAGGQPGAAGGPDGEQKERRRIGRWAEEETQLLIDLVQKHGKGRWKEILVEGLSLGVYKGRNQVDLKDKWRNLEKQKVVQMRANGEYVIYR